MARYLVTKPPGYWTGEKLVPPGEVVELADDAPCPSASFIGLDAAGKANVAKVHAELRRRFSLTPEEREKEAREREAVAADQRTLENLNAHEASVREYEEKAAKKKKKEQDEVDETAVAIGQSLKEGMTLADLAAGGGKTEPTVTPAASTEQASHVPAGPGVVVRKRAADAKV